MRCAAVLSVAAGFVFLFADACRADDKVEAPTVQTKPSYALPTDPQAAVIVLDFQGGFTPPRTSEKPNLTIRRDGSIEIPARFVGQKSFAGKIDQDELQTLLDFIIRENEFFEYDAAAVAAKLAKAGPRFAVADAATTVIKVNTTGKSKEVSHYALGIGTSVPELDRLKAIQQRLMRVQSVVQLGGKEQVAKWLDIANEQLKAQHPDVAPLMADHLQSGGKRSDGSVYISFARIIPRADGKSGAAATTSAFINRPAKGKQTVTVAHRVQ